MTKDVRGEWSTVAIVILVLVCIGGFAYQKSYYDNRIKQVGVLAASDSAQKVASSESAARLSLNDFHQSRSAAISQLDTAQSLANVGEINLHLALQYDELTTALYDKFSVAEYDAELHRSYLETATSQANKASTYAKMSLKGLSGLAEKAPSDFWRQEVNLRIDQANLIDELALSVLKRASAMNRMVTHFVREDLENYEMERKGYNNELVPESRSIHEHLVNKLKEV